MTADLRQDSKAEAHSASVKEGEAQGLSNYVQSLFAKQSGAFCAKEPGPQVPGNDELLQLSGSNEEIKAVKDVLKQKEVGDWLKLFAPCGHSASTGGAPEVIVEGQRGENYTVQLLEQMSDHAASFNFYDVNVRTGAVKPVFE